MPNYYSRSTPRSDLGRALVEFLDNDTNYIGNRLFPSLRMNKKASTYPAITRDSLLRTEDLKRSARGTYNRGEFEVHDKSYACQNYGTEVALDDSDRANFKDDFAADLWATRVAASRVRRAQEIRYAAKAFDTSVFTGAALYLDVSATKPWSTYATAEVFGDVASGREQMLTNCGMEPTHLTVSYSTALDMIQCADIVDRIVNVQAATKDVLEGSLSTILGLNVLIGKGVYSTKKETVVDGSAPSNSAIWDGKYALLSVTPSDGADLTEPSLGRTVIWDDYQKENITMEQYREEQIESDIFRAKHFVDEHLVDPYFGFLIKVKAA